jgi:threonine synthase
VRPYYTEGAKTYGFEVAEQLGWRLPRHIVVPVAGGTILPKIAKGFRELRDLGLVDGDFTIYGAQAAGSAPVIQALHKGTDLISPVKPHTIAKSIAIGNPADGYYVLKAIRESGGWGEMVTDEEIVDSIKLLARTEGIFTEPAGGTTVAVTRKLVAQGRIPRDEPIVICVTGNGYKTLEAVTDGVEQPFRIPARLGDFDALYAQLRGNREASAG